GLVLVPSVLPDVLIKGELRCHCVGPDGVEVDDRYVVRIEVPRGFPRALPRVFETAGKVPRTFHRHPDGSLCLGSPISQRLAIEKDPTIGCFIDRVILPYLYSCAYYARFG